MEMEQSVGSCDESTGVLERRAVDVLGVIDFVIAEIDAEEQKYCRSLCGLRIHESRAAVAELIEAAGDYFTGWCQDEADSPNDGIGPVCGPEQHKAAVRLRDALARVRSS